MAPTATLTSAPNINASGASNTTTSVVVTYADTGGPGINTDTFGNGNITVSNGSTVTGHSAVGNVVTYTITAPSSNWGASTQGTYTIALVAGSVQDTNGSGVAGNPSFGSFTVDTVPPAASLTSAPNITFAQATGNTTTVTITYSDATSGINTETFGVGNITVSNGATVTGVSLRRRHRDLLRSPRPPSTGRAARRDRTRSAWWPGASRSARQRRRGHSILRLLQRGYDADDRLDLGDCLRRYQLQRRARPRRGLDWPMSSSTST